VVGGISNFSEVGTSVPLERFRKEKPTQISAEKEDGACKFIQSNLYIFVV
jgi:hypothetical protein